jgi:glycosyltransferase involved in cell wall biosynthesis
MDVPPRVRRLYAYIERRLAHVTDRIICVSEAERQAALVRAICPPERLVVIPNGLDIEAFDRMAAAEVERGQFGLTDGDFVIGTVGRLDPQKGHAHLLRAAALVLERHPEARFLIVGDGELRSVLEQQARDAGIADRVVFVGRYEPAAALYRLMDLFVLPSLWEGAPYSPLEAMAAGLPVVCSDVGGCRDIVADGETGFLVPPAQPHALAERVLELLEHRDRARAMGRAGRQRVEERLSLERMLLATADLYRQVLTGRREP